MTGSRTSSSAAPNNDMILGEMRGQLREMVHGMNNLSAKFDGLAREVIGLAPLATDVAELRGAVVAHEKAIAAASVAAAEIAALKLEVEALKTEKNRREGASGVVAAILRSPAVGWIVGGAAFMWGILTGRIDL
jgi:hypothetical protein